MTLVVPSVSIGNVPQLAIDLLIHTYGFELHSSLDDKYLCPFAGPVDCVAGAKQSRGVATPAQLYKLPGKDIWLVQLRSPTVPGGKLKFAESLHEELAATKYKDVLILGSANRGMRLDMDADLWSEERDEATLLPESGIVKQLLTVFGGSALVNWTYEGDNVADAEEMAERVAKRLGLAPQTLKQPVSWSRVYGKDVPLGVEAGIYT